jgi:PAS domain S-box-containing protein
MYLPEDSPYRRLIHNLPDVLWTADERGQTVFISPNVEELLGYCPEELYGDGGSIWPGRIHPEDREDVLRTYAALFRERVAYSVEYRMQHKNGTWIWIHDRSMSTYEKNGVLYADGMFSDVSERRRRDHMREVGRSVAEALAFSTSLGEAVARILGAVCQGMGWIWGAFWRVDAQARRLRCLDTYCAPGEPLEEFEAVSRRLVLPPGEGLAGRAWQTREPLWVEEPSTVAAPLRAVAAVRAGLRGGFVLPVLVRGEVAAVLEFSTQDRKAPDGELLAMLSGLGMQIGQFIERIRAEEALRASEHRLRGLLGGMNGAVLEVDAETHCLHVWSHDERHLGGPRAEIVGRTLVDVWGEAVGAPLADCVRRVLASGRAEIHEYHREVGETGGETHWFLADVSCAPPVAGAAPTAVLFVRDVTEHKQAEQASILYRQAVRAREAAIDAEEGERSRIARELHDETGQALTSLLVRLRALEDRGEGAELRDELRALRRLTAETLEDLGRLVHDLHPSALDQLGLVAALRHLAAEFIRTHGVAVDVHIVNRGVPGDGGEGPGEGDEPGMPAAVERTLYRMAQEALTNVARHARASQVSIILAWRQGQVQLVIEDDGHGFDPQALEYTAGGGMGLRGMRERITLHGGAFKVESHPGRGTALFARIPLTHGESWT